MKITLHPLSVLVGLALACLVAISTGAAQSVQPIPKRTVLVGEVPPEWWTYLDLNQVTPYAVPTGKRLVVTTCWNNNGTGLFANGEDMSARLFGVLGNPIGAYQIGNGTRLVFEPGTLLTAMGGGGRVQLWGYLAPVH